MQPLGTKRSLHLFITAKATFALCKQAFGTSHSLTT